MDNNQRKEFWDLLCSLNGTDINNDREKLLEVINYPRYLYRYRPVTIKNIDALRTNRMFFSTANYYDDPFDTFIHINIPFLNQFIDEQKQSFDEQKALDVATAICHVMFPNEQSSSVPKEIVSRLEATLQDSNFKLFCLNYLRNIRNEIKKDVLSVCFSENAFNEVLWLKYAEQHKGFAVQYDLQQSDHLLCGTQEKCENCGVNKYRFSLYPVFYSDLPYDGSKYAQYICAMQLISKMFLVNNASDLDAINTVACLFGNMNWQSERISLIKKECHQYDEEWRAIINGPMKPPVSVEWVPSAVLLGLKMSEQAKGLVISAAREAKIQNIYQIFINDYGCLDGYAI